MKSFAHNPTEILAIQVARPWIHVQNKVPFASQVKEASGKFSWFRVANVGDLNVQRAYEGDWITKDRRGLYGVMTDEEFQFNYGKDADDDSNTPED